MLNKESSGPASFYKRENVQIYELPMSRLERMASTGDEDAAFALGKHYILGEGRPGQNPTISSRPRHGGKSLLLLGMPKRSACCRWSFSQSRKAKMSGFLFGSMCFEDSIWD